MTMVDKRWRRALRDAVEEAAAAPSIFNTQPWWWIVEDDMLHLLRDSSRRLEIVDPDGRQMVISCGAALHHALVVLSAQGLRAKVASCVDGLDSDLLATINLAGETESTSRHASQVTAIRRRRTDRRAFSAEPVPSATTSMMVAAAEEQGAHVHLVTRDQVGMLRDAATRAEATHLADPGYRCELARWTTRPVNARDGVLVDTAVWPSPRLVPVRSFAPPADSGSPGFAHDLGASYFVIFTDGDSCSDWLQAGQALSAVLLTATVAGLATSPISDVIEVAQTRAAIRWMLDGPGQPQILVRVGHAPDAAEVLSSPRREPTDVIMSELSQTMRS